MSAPSSLRLGAALGLLALVAPAGAQYINGGGGSSSGGPGNLYGHAVAQLHDIDGNGYDEFLFGIPGRDFAGPEAGSVYVYDDYQGFLYTLDGAPGDQLGWSAANLGDVDGDGYDDFVVGRPGRDFNGADAGGVIVYSGASGIPLWSKTWTQAGARAGSVVAAAGDVNGDGRGDVLVGAPDWNGPNVLTDADWGRAVLYSGSNGLALATITGTSKDDRLGAALAGLPDLNGDGVPEFAIGVPGKEVGSPFSIVNAGACQVYSGATKALLFSIGGGSANEFCGSSITKLGDSDLDGLLEFAVGRPGWSSQRGRVTVHEGPLGATIATIVGLGSSSADAFGSAVCAAGDLNKDGYVDLVVGAPCAGTGLGGYTQAFRGDDWTQYRETFFTTDFSVHAVDSGFGMTIAAGLDTSGDGWADVLFGLPEYDGTASANGVAWSVTFQYNQKDYSPTNLYQTGLARLEMYGTELSTGGLADLRIRYAPPATLVYLLLSLDDALLPFKGGVIVPDPATSVIIPLVTDADGLILITDIPGGGGPLDIIIQGVMKNPAGPQGWWITSAIKAQWLP